MTALKKMSGTSDFLGMTEVERKCQLDLLETCRLEAFYAAGEACQCVPWELPNPYKVEQLKSLMIISRRASQSAFLKGETASTSLRTRTSTAA